MGFGWPTRYLALDVSKVEGGASSWDGQFKILIQSSKFKFIP
jgi:hypothetical protein